MLGFQGEGSWSGSGSEMEKVNCNWEERIWFAKDEFVQGQRSGQRAGLRVLTLWPGCRCPGSSTQSRNLVSLAHASPPPDGEPHAWFCERALGIVAQSFLDCALPRSLRKVSPHSRLRLSAGVLV